MLPYPPVIFPDDVNLVQYPLSDPHINVPLISAEVHFSFPASDILEYVDDQAIFDAFNLIVLAFCSINDSTSSSVTLNLISEAFCSIDDLRVPSAFVARVTSAVIASDDTLNFPSAYYFAFVNASSMLSSSPFL